MLKKVLNTPLPAILWSVFVLILLIIPGNEFERTGLLHVPGLDKVIHILLFGTMVFLWSRYYASRSKEKSQVLRKFAQIILLTISFGIAIEFIQKYFIPLRSFDLWDIIADGSGALISGFIYFKVWTKK